MPAIDQVAYDQLKPELLPGETILWAGRPNTRIIFHCSDAQLIPFSLIWGSLGVFAEVAPILALSGHLSSRILLSPPAPVMAILGIPFFVIGNYLIWGRFLQAARKKKRAYYAVTNQRVLALINLSKRQLASHTIRTLPAVIKEKRSDGFGTVRFGPTPQPWGTGEWTPMFGEEANREGRRRTAAWDPLWIGEGPVLADIEDVDSVCQLISALQSRQIEAEVSARLAERRASHPESPCVRSLSKSRLP